MSMAVEPDSAGVRFPPPFVYLGALLLGLAAERFVTLRSFGIDWRLLVATGALLFVAGAAMMLAATGLFRRLGTNVPPSQQRPSSQRPVLIGGPAIPCISAWRLSMPALRSASTGRSPSPCSRWCCSRSRHR